MRKFRVGAGPQNHRGPVGSLEPVSFYGEQILPRLVDRACSAREVSRWRERAVDGLVGRVVEVGFGSGLNVALYPPEVDVVLAVEPAATARKLAEKRVRASSVPVEHVGLDGGSIPIEDAGCDAALSTFTLCTIPDVQRALAELRRVLRPGGRLHFLEHGRSPDARVAAWQARFEPLQKRLAGGCHLTRDPLALVTEAGFHLERAEQHYVGGPTPWTFFTIGVAARPAS